MIAIEREKLEQVLEALENHCGNYKLDDAGCDRLEKAITAIKEALAQPEQEPVARVIDNGTPEGATEWIPFANRIEPLKTGDLLYTHAEERNFCPRCGKRTANLTTIHTCTPPQENT